MSSERKEFWEKKSFAVVGHGKRMKFPVITYGALKKKGKTVYPVDPSAQLVEGDRAYASLAQLPAKPEAIVIETPADETAAWVKQAAEAGIRSVWIHPGSESSAAIELAGKQGMELRTGMCAVMYLLPHEFPHSFHRWVMDLLKRY